MAPYRNLDFAREMIIIELISVIFPVILILRILPKMRECGEVLSSHKPHWPSRHVKSTRRYKRDVRWRTNLFRLLNKAAEMNMASVDDEKPIKRLNNKFRSLHLSQRSLLGRSNCSPSFRALACDEINLGPLIMIINTCLNYIGNVCFQPSGL